MPLHGNQVFKSMILWRPFLITPPQCIKRHQESGKTTYRMRENVYKSCLSVFSGLTIHPSGFIDCLMKTPILGMRSPLSHYSSGESKRLPKHYRLLLLPLIASQRLKIRSYCWWHHVLWTQDAEDLNSIWSESLLPDDQKMPCKHAGREATNSPTKLSCLWAQTTASTAG